MATSTWSSGASRPIAPLPVDADLAELAERWEWESLTLDRMVRDRIMNAALGFPAEASQGERSDLVHQCSWVPDELCARFELARRELGIVAVPRRPQPRWRSVTYRWFRRLRSMIGDSCRQPGRHRNGNVRFWR